MQVPVPGALEASYQRPATTSRTAVFSAAAATTDLAPMLPVQLWRRTRRLIRDSARQDG